MLPKDVSFLVHFSHITFFRIQIKEDQKEDRNLDDGKQGHHLKVRISQVVEECQRGAVALELTLDVDDVHEVDDGVRNVNGVDETEERVETMV